MTALTDTNQLIVARYLYDPFGNLLSLSGPLAEVNLYRFSSKECHPASGLVYYLYRYYDPNLQRWVNRDPVKKVIAESPFLFVKNSPIDSMDPYGLWGVKICGVTQILA